MGNFRHFRVVLDQLVESWCGVLQEVAAVIVAVDELFLEPFRLIERRCQREWLLIAEVGDQCGRCFPEV